MAYQYTNAKGVVYYLHETTVVLRGGKERKIRFFAKVPNNPKGQPLDAIPEGFEVRPSKLGGMPTLGRIKKD